MSNFDGGRLKQFFYLLLLLGLGLLLFFELYPYISAFLGALTFYVLFRKAFFYLHFKKGWKKSPTALLIILLSFLIIVLPIGVLVKLLINKLTSVLSSTEDLSTMLDNFITSLNEKAGFEVLSEETAQQIPERLAKDGPGVLMGALDVLIILSLLYLILYYMLVRGREMEHWLREHLPLRDENVKKVGNEVVGMVMSNAVGIPLLAIAQAGFAYGAYYFLGVPDPVLWGVVTAFASLLPVIGSTAVWFPLSLYLYFTGNEWQGIVLWVYGVVVIINIDNVFRMILQKKMADVHPLITLFGVIAGISLFGFMGIIFGPLLISMFILLCRIYYDEFMKKSREIVIP